MNKDPLHWTECPRCSRPYGFINCRISKGAQSLCMACAIDPGFAAKKLGIAELQPKNEVVG